MSRSKWFGAVVALAVLAVSTDKLCAQDIPETCTFAATVVIQNTNSTFNTNTTAFNTPPPTVLKFATKDLIALIAKAQYNQGYYGATNFPSGVKLMRVYGTSFQIWDQSGNMLVDCSDQIGFGQYYDFPTYTATGTDNNTTAGSETDYGFAELDIYDLDAGGVTDLQLYGSVLNTIKTSAANKNTGAVNSTQSFTIKALGGEGAIGNNDVFNSAVTGSFSAKGTGPLY